MKTKLFIQFGSVFLLLSLLLVACQEKEEIIPIEDSRLESQEKLERQHAQAKIALCCDTCTVDGAISSPRFSSGGTLFFFTSAGCAIGRVTIPAGSQVVEFSEAVSSILSEDIRVRYYSRSGNRGALKLVVNQICGVAGERDQITVLPYRGQADIVVGQYVCNFSK